MKELDQKIKCLLFIVLLILTIMIMFYPNTVFAADKDVTYLSDIPYDSTLSKVGWGSITMDKTTKEDGGNTLSLKIDGSAVVFKKGIFAHAESTIVYDISSYDYDYFTTYYGVSAHRGNNGNIKVYIYTSNDKKNWTLETEASPAAMTGSTNAKFVKIPIKGKKYIKLYANPNGTNAADHAVYGDAKLIKEGYNDNVTKTVEEYDELIKSKYNGEITDEIELLLLQRNLVKKVGQYTLKTFVEDNEKNKETLEWIMNNQEALKLYTVGGKPDGTYERALNVLSNLYHTYKDDLNDETKFTNTFGTVVAKDLYLKMMLSLSLTHSTNVYLWVDSSSTSNALTRYAIYKDMHIKGKLNNDIFENLTVEEMRWVMNNIIDDEEIEWLNDLMKKRNLNDGHGAYQFITYRSGYNYSKAQYYSAENYDKWNQKYDLKSHNITYATGHPRLWIVFEEGSVCGGIAKTWSNMKAARGIPSSVVGQPGHAAAIAYSIDNKGNGIWNLVNDVSGWSNSGRTERIGIRMPNEWGEYNIATYTANLKPDSYVILAQQAQNEYPKYEASEIVLLLEDVYKNDHKKLDEVYKKALEEEAINFDALYGLVMLYKNDQTFTEEQCYELAKTIATTYTYHPLPMYDLLRTLNSRFTTPNYMAKVATLQETSLRKASVATASNALQYSVAKTLANTILGLTDNTIATFSFDGNNAGKIILSSRFDASEVRWDYSLDNGATWTQTGDKFVSLSDEEISKITAENDIKIHLIGVSYDAENIFTIDITKATKPSGLYNNDLENKVIGVSNTMEWRIGDTGPWTSYKTANPDLTGNKSVRVRVGPTKTSLPSDSVTLNFTSDNQPDIRKYISISNLSIASASSEATANAGNKEHAIDGNINTIWHSAYNGSDTQRYIVIKLKEAKYISALEYVPRQSGTNGRIKDYVLYLSMDGNEWTQVSTGAWANSGATKAINLEESIKAQYVKLQAKTNYGDGRNFISALMINLFEDTTGDRPRATIEYSTTTSTAKPVVATLKPLNDAEVKVTNNDGNFTYTFTENGEFTFNFLGTNGKTGSATARVNWMKNCEFSFDGKDKNKIILSKKYAPTEEDQETLEWEYSIDGGNTWKTIKNTLEIQLDDNEIEKVKSNSNIKLKVHITESAVGTDEYTVDITGGGTLPTTLYANDLENKIMDMTKEMEWRSNIGEEKWTDWVSCENGIPTFEGDKTVEVRYSATGTTKEGPSKIFTFTADEVNSKKKYISIDHLSLESYSTQTDREGNREYAKNALDGNINTMWHTNRVIADENRYIIIKLDKPRFISHVQYVAKPNYVYGVLKEGNISVSLDGAKWTENVSKVSGERYTSASQLTDKYVQEFYFEDSIYASYIRFKCSESYDYLQKADADYFVNAAMFNLFEDTEKDWEDTIAPTVNITYSNKEATFDPVVVTMRFSEPVKILTENILLVQDEKDPLTYTYTFKENLSFVLKYEDEAGNKGEDIKILVDWIKKAASVAKVTYSTTSLTNQSVTATVTCDEPITITNNDGKNTYTFIENGTIEFVYVNEAYSMGKVTASVDWIDKTPPVGEIKYSTTESTKEKVVATLECNEEVTITNNDGKNTYEFTKNGEFKFEFKDSAGNINSATAKVDWIEEEPIEDKISSEKYEVKDSFISKILPNTTISDFKKNITIVTKKEVVFEDKKGNLLKDTDKIGTGMKLKVGDNIELELVVIGDTDGNVKVDIDDLARLKIHSIDIKKLEGVYLKAADIDLDDKITINDVARLKLSLIGKVTIE